MKREKILIYGKHSVFSALTNLSRQIDEVLIAKESMPLKNKIDSLVYKYQRKIKVSFVDIKYLEVLLKKKVKHQGIVARSYKVSFPNYSMILKDEKLSFGVILDRLTDPNNIGAIYRSAKAFDMDFIINTKRSSLIESSSLINSSCGAFDEINTFVTNNISNAIKKLQSDGWWIIGLDHKAKVNIEEVIKKIDTKEKYIFIFGSEGKGIRKLIKKNCSLIACIPTTKSSESINVSNSAAVVFYELYKMRIHKKT